MHDYSQQQAAGQKSGLVRGAIGKLSDLISNDLDTLLSSIASGNIGGIKLEPSTVQRILESAAVSVIESRTRSAAAMSEMAARHKFRLEIEQARHANRLSERKARTGLNVGPDAGPDCMTTSELMSQIGSQEQAQSTIDRPSPELTFGQWYESLNRRQRGIVAGWFDATEHMIAADSMVACFVYDQMNLCH